MGMGKLLVIGLRGCAVLWVGLSGGCVFFDDPYGPDQLDPGGENLPRITIGAGDQLEIKFIYTESLNTIQEVRRDGCVTLHLIGDLKVAGLSCREAELRINAAYKSDLKNPKVTVFLRSQWGRRFYVMGEVRRPGIHTMPTRMSIMESIVLAGGFSANSAALDSVLVIRQEGEVRRIGKFNLKPSFGMEPPPEGQKIKPFYLKPGDVIYVPVTKIVQLDRWLDQHIHRVIRGTDMGFRTGTTDVRYDLSN